MFFFFSSKWQTHEINRICKPMWRGTTTGTTTGTATGAATGTATGSSTLQYSVHIR